ncbi:prephenate dehydrogenase (NADP(+)) [Collariella sp. IMI 366227]|nr:prephenate dehydrogenase (NADP(+)) [Collariella sp. IMI 366227]
MASTMTPPFRGAEDFVIGLIGMGDMGKMIMACDREEKYDELVREFANHKNIQILRNGHLVSRASNYIIYSVEAAIIDRRVYLTAKEHDRITADTQAVTHAAFLSMGKAWHANAQFPWEGTRYVGGIENVKINLMLRIYAQKWHVYAGLAILNPEAHKQINQFAKSTTELFYLMLEGRREELRERVYRAKEKVLGEGGAKWAEKPLLPDGVVDRFSLNPAAKESGGPPMPNNHLSLLAMVDCWSALGIVPYDHMICSTPLFRLWLGVTEHLFRTPGLLDECLRVGIEDNTFRRDDLQFTIAASGWAECVALRQFETWRERFAVTQKFFEPRFAESVEIGQAMIKAVLESG